MIAIYYRVSTEDQTLNMQKHAVEEWIVKNKITGNQTVYEDLAMSGANSRRPGFTKMCKDMEYGRLKHVIVYNLDRLTRDAVTAIRFVLRLDELDIIFTSVSQPMFSHGMPFRHAIIAIFAELAQMEREMIVERVKVGLAAAVKRGVILGAPKKITPEVVQKIRTLRNSGMTYKNISKQVHVSTGSISRVLSV